MIILDTSIWIEFLKGNPNYFMVARYLLENQEVIAVECIFGELLQGAKNKKESEIIRHYWENLPKINHEGLWIKAGEYSSENNLLSKGVGLIDAAIIIAAQRISAQIWTLDKKLNSILGNDIQYIP